ncbi:hypothetical protein B0675_39220 [Streptomyces sp. M41(2017)]|nr:hypothetical protein B0675_39220 [Streptomyces sp. M41(2017)]
MSGRGVSQPTAQINDPRVDAEFSRFYDKSFKRLVRETTRGTRDRGWAEDAVQEALLAVLGRWRSIEHPDRYVRTVLRNLLAKQATEAPTLVPVEELGSEGIERDVTDDVHLRMAIMAVMHELPQQQQRATALHYLADMSVDQVAEDLGVAKSTVRVHLMQARRYIHESWE